MGLRFIALWWRRRFIFSAGVIVMRFLAALSLLSGLFVTGEANASTITLSQGSNSVITATDSINAASQNTRQTN